MTEKQSMKKTRMKEFLSVLWSSYANMHETRETNTRNSINFLLLTATFFPVLCLALYGEFKSELFLFPILFQVAALLNLLKSFFIKGTIPWYELKGTLSQFDNDSFEVDILAQLKAAESDTFRRMRALNTIVKRALFLLVFSILIIALACIFILWKGSVGSISSVV